jgi:SAM-dependent methyltransferase
MAIFKKLRMAVLGSSSKCCKEFQQTDADPEVSLVHSDTQTDADPEWVPVCANERIRVVFLVLTPQIWPSLAPVWSRMAADDRFDTKVVALENAGSADSHSELVGVYELLAAENIPFVRQSVFSLEVFRPHVIFYPLPYHNLYPAEYSAERAHALGARIAYVPYGLEVGGGAYNAKYQHDEPLLRGAWRVFARSRHQVANFARYCVTGNAQVVLTGHPRADRDASAEGKLPEAVLERASGRKIVIWAPHFSVTRRRKWSSFLENHEDMLAEIRARQDLFFIFRPHPFLRSTLRDVDGWTDQSVEDLFGKFSELENLHFDTASAYWPTFNSSDALITDPGSFLVEYLLADMPICMMQSQDGIGLAQEAAGFNCFALGATRQDIARFLDLVADGRDNQSAARQAAREAYFGPEDGKVAARIVEEVAKSITDRPYLAPKAVANARHEAAFKYWQAATTTFLAPEDYYARQEVLMKDLLDQLGHFEFVMDVGCGNGRYTEIFAQYSQFVEAVDPGLALIEEARENAESKGINNIEYRVENIEEPAFISTYDLVSCMGVLSGIIDNEKFIQSTHWLRAACKPGATLILKESLSVGTPQSVDADGYVAVYRNMTSYLEAFRVAGFKLQDEIIIAPTNEKGMTNRLFVFEALKQQSVQ